MGLVTEKRQGWESAVDVFGNLVETGVVEAIKFGPEISFGDAYDFELIEPEGSLAGGKEGFEIEDKGFVGFAGLEEIGVDLGNLAGITSHLVIIFVYEYDLILKIPQALNFFYLLFVVNVLLLLFRVTISNKVFKFGLSYLWAKISWKLKIKNQLFIEFGIISIWISFMVETSVDSNSDYTTCHGPDPKTLNKFFWG